MKFTLALLATIASCASAFPNFAPSPFPYPVYTPPAAPAAPGRSVTDWTDRPVTVEDPRFTPSVPTPWTPPTNWNTFNANWNTFAEGTPINTAFGVLGTLNTGRLVLNENGENLLASGQLVDLGQQVQALLNGANNPQLQAFLYQTPFTPNALGTQYYNQAFGPMTYGMPFGAYGTGWQGETYTGNPYGFSPYYGNGNWNNQWNNQWHNQWNNGWNNQWNNGWNNQWNNQWNYNPVNWSGNWNVGATAHPNYPWGW